jgi:beta-glucosidase
VAYHRIAPDVIGCAAHRAVALEAAREAIVLLHNRDGLLPFDKARLRRVAVLGPFADRVVLNNYNGKTGATVTALQGLRDRLGAGVEVVHAPGCAVAGDAGVATKVDREAGFSGGASVKLEAHGVGAWLEVAVDVPVAGRYDLRLHYKSFPSRGVFRLSVDGAAQGEPLDMYAATGGYGQVAAHGARELTAGRHTLRWTVAGKHAASTGYDGHFDRLVLAGPRELSWEIEQLPFTAGGGDGQADRAVAVAAARGADVTIVCVGTDASIEHEGRDRRTLALPAAQEELVKAVVAANPRTVVVQMSAGPLAVAWLKAHVPAMLQAWWGGEEGGHALADVLVGDANPAGRLPHTVYAADAQVPPRDVYDISRGFAYMYVQGEPLYCFGHGLSYTRFAYESLRLSTARLAADGTLTVTADVTNTGARAGDEVVQLYVRALDSRVVRAAKELRGFQRIGLQPGERRTLSFALPAAKLAYWDEATHALVVEPGRYEVQLGASALDIRLTATVQVGAG